jgi:hypothetical protein
MSTKMAFAILTKTRQPIQHLEKEMEPGIAPGLALHKDKNKEPEKV